jgi:hypothetical protein
MNRGFVIKGGFLFLFSLIVGWAIYSPGFMSADSFSQYDIARTHNYSDWHPPVMSWVWSGLNLFFNGPQGLLFLHLSLLCAGLYLINLFFSGYRYAWAIWIVFYLPWVLNFSGVLWKDVGMAFSLLLAVAVGIQKRTLVNVFLFLLLMFYAINLRYNGIFAAFPLMLMVVNGWWPNLAWWRNVCVSFCTLIFVVFIGGLFNYNYLAAEKTNPSSYMMVDDLAFMSIKQGVSLIPDTEFGDILRCATQVVGQGKLVGRSFCLPGSTHSKSANIYNEKVKKEWIAQVTAHPLDYLQFRLAAFSYLIRSPGMMPYFIWQPGVDSNSMGIVREASDATSFVNSYVSTSADYFPFLFKPFWWLWFASILLIASLYMRRSRARAISQALLSSAIFYICGYVPLTAMADFRYVYWSVLATTVAFIIMLLSCRLRVVKVSPWIHAAGLFIAVLGTMLILNFDKIFFVNTDALVLRSLSDAPVSLKEPSISYQLDKTSSNSYSVTGIDPKFIYNISPNDTRTEGRTLIAFDFECKGTGVEPRMQIFWWGGQKSGPVEEDSIMLSLHKGLNLIAIPQLKQYHGESFLKGLRFDLSNPEACSNISFSGLSVYGI